MNPQLACPPRAPAAHFTPEDFERACSLAQQQAARGRIAAAQTILGAVLERQPDFFPALVIRGHLAEGAGDFAAAVASYEAAMAVNPGHALPFTRRALIKLRMALGDPARPRPRDTARPFVTMNDLGANGRFGNQLLQYGLLRLYAAKAGAQALVPDWIGRDLFGLDDPTAAGATPTATLDEAAILAGVAGQAQPPANVNLTGYFCGDTSAWAAGRAEFARCFRPVAKVKARADAALRQLGPAGRKLVALHVRRGDFGTGRFWLAPSAWYREWLARHRAEIGDAVIYLASDDAAVRAEFAEWPIVTAGQLGEPIPGAEFFLDHWVLRHADWLATSNSTFSLTAALLNQKAARCFRPDRAANGLREFNPWAEPVLLD